MTRRREFLVDDELDHQGHAQITDAEGNFVGTINDPADARAILAKPVAPTARHWFCAFLVVLAFVAGLAIAWLNPLSERL